MARGRERSLVAVNLEQTLPIGGQRDVERARADADRGRDAQPARHARARQRVRAIVEQRHAELVERPRRVKCAERVEQRHLRVRTRRVKAERAQQPLLRQRELLLSRPILV